MRPDVHEREIEMYQFRCGHEECGSQFAAVEKSDLMIQVAQHLKDAHGIEGVTKTLLSYLESTCVTAQQS